MIRIKILKINDSQTVFWGENTLKVFQKFLLSLCFLFFVAVVSAQTGQVFWFAAPEISSGHQDSPIRICVSSFDQPASVTISQPANPSFTPITFTLGVNDFEITDMSSFKSDLECDPINTVLNKGLKIEATASVSVYYEVVGNNSEIYTLKGDNALGTDFIVSAQFYLDNGGYSPPSRHKIEIVAIENNTHVTIVVPINYDGGTANTPVNVTLNAGQVYVVRAAGTLASQHLHNTRVTSDKPIAVNSSDDSPQSGSHLDLVGEQLVPVSLAGDQYIVISNEEIYESVYIFPTQNNTQVYINGSTVPITTLDLGDDYMYMITQTATYITATAPIIVFQLTGDSQEAGGTVLPQLECTGSTEVVYTRPYTSDLLKINLIVKTVDKDFFSFNGNSNFFTSSDFVTLPYNPTWSYCKKDVSAYIPINTLMYISNSSGPFHLGLVDSDVLVSCSIGYFSGYSYTGSIKFKMRDEFCQNDSIPFEFECKGVDSIRIVCPSGNILTQNPYTIYDVTTADNGWYYIYARDTIGCYQLTLVDSIHINVTTTYLPNLGNDLNICSGEIIAISANYSGANASYVWNTGATTSQILVVTGGEYSVKVSTPNADSSIVCYGYDTVQVFINPQPIAEFKADKTEGCTPVNVIFNNLTTPDSLEMIYEWYIYNSEGAPVFTSTLENPEFTFTEMGSYHVQLFVTSPQGCVDSLMKWNYIVAYPQPGAAFDAEPEISFLSDNEGNVFFHNYMDSTVLALDETSWYWDFGDETTDETEFSPTHQYATWGDYVVTFFVETPGGCTDQISHIVTIEEELRFPNIITPNEDRYNNFFAIENLNTEINPEDPDQYRTNLLVIYNRWGKKVYEAKDYDSYMKDGEVVKGSKFFDAEGLPNGEYYFSFYYKGKLKETKYSGSLMILR